MNSFLKNIDIELSKKILSFEKNNGELIRFAVCEFLADCEQNMVCFNSFLKQTHKMTMDGDFCEPDLDNLIDYEEELDGRN